MKHPAPIRANRETITLSTIEAAILHLMESGKRPSEPNIRDLIGGSPNTIQPLIDRWFAERGREFLAGRISIVQSSDLPQAAHDLIAELRADARRAADADVAKAMDTAAEKAAEAETAIAALRAREVEFQAKKDTLEQVQADLRADIAMTRADATAARAAADAAAAERREAIAAMEAAEAMAKDAEKREQQTQSDLRACEEALGSAKQRLQFAQVEINQLRAASAEKDAAHSKAAGEAAATITSLRESIEEIKTAHLREVQALRQTQSDSAARWAEARANLEKRIATLQSDVQAADARAVEAEASVARLAMERDALASRCSAAEATLEDRAEHEEHLRQRCAELEKLVTRMPAGVADLSERIKSIERQLAGLPKE